MLEIILFGIVGGAIGVSTGLLLNKNKIPENEFVKRDELAKVLRQRGIKIGEETECVICHKKLGLDNIGKVIPIDDTIKFICDNDECMIMQNSIYFGK